MSAPTTMTTTRRPGRPTTTTTTAEKKSASPAPPSKLTGSAEAKKRASVVLEVLAGLRTPTDGSVVLGVSLQRYYLLETRALQGLVSALDAKPRPGRQPTLQGELTRARAERDRLERELRRAQALVRAAQRTVGIAPPSAPAPKAKGKRTRRPTVRARRLARALEHEAQAAAPERAVTAANGSGATTAAATDGRTS